MEAPSSMGAAAAAAAGYAESLDSTPDSRSAESWEEPPFACAASAKLRLMCSYGGRIVPRPTDKALCYLGGETRIVVVERGGSLADLRERLARTFPLGGRPFALRYQLPSEDLDSLISVSTDEDLDNLVDEYDRLLLTFSNPSKPARIRLFLFPSGNSDSESAASSAIGSFLEDDSKSESWFMDALNSALPHGGGSAGSASVNSLLGLNDDDSSAHSRGGGGGGKVELQLHHHHLEKIAQHGHGQDVQSIPDSPMLETASSSFGSTSSAFSLSNLPRVGVRPDNRHHDQLVGGLEEHFARLSLPSSAAPAPTAATAAGQTADEGFNLFNVSASTPTISPNEIPCSSCAVFQPAENPHMVFSSPDGKPEHGGGAQRAAHMPQPNPYLLQLPTSDLLTSNQVPPFQAPSSGYTLPLVQPDQLQRYPQHHSQPSAHASQHYFHHHASGTVPAAPATYQVPYMVQQPYAFDQRVPMYYMPVQQVPPYSSTVQPNPGNPNPISLVGGSSAPPSNPVLLQRGDGSNTVLSNKPELPANVYRTVVPTTQPTMQPEPPTTLVPVAPDQARTYNSTGYYVMHPHPSQSLAAMDNYAYEFAAPTSSQGYYAQMALASQYQTGSTVAAPPPLQQANMRQPREP